jgi:hypothetical protein
MSAKLTHLSLIYGDAGARDKFQDLVVHLIRSERPDVAGIRIVRGDGGIDAHEGSLADSTGVDVFQIKYFPKEVGDSQKAQIRESFATVRDGKRFKAKSWRLCLPIDLGVDEKLWFEVWAAKARDSGIDVLRPWGATELEGLLYASKNCGLMETFFPPRQLVNAAVNIQGRGAIQISGPNAVNIAPGGIQIHGPVVLDNSAHIAMGHSSPPKRSLSEIEFEVLKIVGLVKDAKTHDVAVRLGIGIERAKFYLDELSRAHRLIDWIGNMDRQIPDRYLLTHEGRRLLVERGVLR